MFYTRKGECLQGTGPQLGGWKYTASSQKVLCNLRIVKIFTEFTLFTLPQLLILSVRHGDGKEAVKPVLNLTS